MLTPEQLINDLQKQVIKLEVELAEAQQDIRDFEVLASEWRKGHSELQRRHKIELGNAQQIIEQLEKDLKEFKSIES